MDVVARIRHASSAGHAGDPALKRTGRPAEIEQVLSPAREPSGSPDRRWRAALPHGRGLPAPVWASRHRMLRRLLWLHALALPLASHLLDRHPAPHDVAHAVPVAALAWLAGRGGSRRFQSACVALGLMTASATLVHVMHGATHAHFHFFVVVSLLALYEDWLPYGLGVGYVFLHHALLGVVLPHEVFPTTENVVAMALVHAGFVSAACVANVVFWRANERSRAETEASSRVVALQYDFTRILARSLTLEAAVPQLLELIGRRLRWEVGMYWAGDAGRLRPRMTWQANAALDPLVRELQATPGYERGEGLAGRVWATGEPAWSRSLPAELPAGQRHIVERLGQRAAIALPVASGTEILGVLTFASSAQRSFDAASVQLLETLSDQLAVFVDRVRRARQADALRDAAMTDALTGLPNRRAWDERLLEHVAWADRQDLPLCLALIDLDRFKAFNDTRGHQAGDALLGRAARTWRSLVRRQDVLARYGGEEFALALPACGLDEAQEIVERLRAQVPAGQTCSIGLAMREPGECPLQVLARADAALYAGKRAGRDRVVVAAAHATA